MLSTRYALLAALALPAPALAGDIVVGPGPDADFDRVDDAVDAAQPGDRIFVQPGDYPGEVHIDKSLELIGSGSDVTELNPFATFPGVLSDTLLIKDLGPNDRVRVVGFRLMGPGLTIHTPGHVLGVVNCKGRVELADLEVLGNSLAFTGEAAYATFHTSAQVLATDVRSKPAAQAGGVGTQMASGVRVQASEVWFQGCEFAGAPGLVPLPTFGIEGSDGGHGIVAQDSVVRMGRTMAVGGEAHGGDGFTVASQGGAGILAQGSEVIVYGGTGAEVRGADASDPGTTPGYVGFAGAGAVLDATSSLLFASDAVPVGGAGEGAAPPALAIDATPGAVVTALPFPLPTLAVEPVLAPAGTPLTVTLEGTPGSTHLRAIAFESAPAQKLVGIFENLLLPLPGLILLPPVTLDANGQASLPSGFPADPSLAALGLVEQSLEAGPNGFALSPPTLFGLGF